MRIVFRLHQLLVLFETDGEKTIKKIAGFHQFHAVREAVQATIAAANRRFGDKKQALFGIPKARVKVFPCVVMQVNYYSSLPCTTQLC